MATVSKELVRRLQNKAIQIRKDICITTSKIGYSHLGGGMSMVDFAVALYYDYLNFDPRNPKDPGRDRFVLSKGHCAHVLYNIFVDLEMYTKEELHSEYNQVNGRFGMHPNRMYVNGIEASTGSLGHGLSIAVGMALCGRMDRKNYRVICMTGDGELDEGSNWEAIMSAGHYGLSNFVMVVDRNNLQINGPTETIMSLEPLEDKMRAFKWDAQTIDGHNMRQILETLHALPPSESVERKRPICIILNTVKGRGLPHLEGIAASHLGTMNGEVLEKSLVAIEAMRSEGGN